MEEVPERAYLSLFIHLVVGELDFFEGDDLLAQLLGGERCILRYHKFSWRRLWCRGGSRCSSRFGSRGRGRFRGGRTFLRLLLRLRLSFLLRLLLLLCPSGRQKGSPLEAPTSIRNLSGISGAIHQLLAHRPFSSLFLIRRAHFCLFLSTLFIFAKLPNMAC